MALARERSAQFAALFNKLRQDCNLISTCYNANPDKQIIHRKISQNNFNNLIDNSNVNNSYSGLGNNSNGLLHSSNQVQTFNRFAQLFAKSITSVSEDILSLTKITAKQNVFEDQSGQITSLTERIKFSLQRLHNDLDTLQELKKTALTSNKYNGGGKTPFQASNIFALKKNDTSHGSQKHSQIVINTLKYQLARTGQAFRSTLQQQSNTIKSSTYRRQMFTVADKSQSFESALFHDQLNHNENTLLSQQQLMIGNHQDHYFRQRVEAVAQIEASVAQVGELFNDFSRLVQQQGESVVRIDTDVEDALRNVDAGSNELMRYLTNLSTNRGLIVKIFFVLFLFLLFFGLFVIR